MPERTCFVVMGFDVKTDYKTGRDLDLNKTYKHIIKPAVENAGLSCIRADEIERSGVIDEAMYERLFQSELVVADLSTANPNALYELGVRHALKPKTTIIIAEDRFESPFNVNHINILRYKHHGLALDIEEAEKSKKELEDRIRAVLADGHDDSPVYTFIDDLVPPEVPRVEEPGQPPSRSVPRPGSEAFVGDEPQEAPQPTIASLMERAAAARDDGHFSQAAEVLRSVFGRTAEGRSADSYLLQQLAVATMRAEEPTKEEAIEEARRVLALSNPMRSNAPETLGIWGAIHLRREQVTNNNEDFDTAFSAFEKGYALGSYYAGINYAYLLNVRSAAENADEQDAIADAVLANRVRRVVDKLCDAELANAEGTNLGRKDLFRLHATKASAASGLGNEASAAEQLSKATQYGMDWEIAQTEDHLRRLRRLVDKAPLKRSRGPSQGSARH